MTHSTVNTPLLVVLDLDETLIHSRGYMEGVSYDFIIPQSVDDPAPLYGTVIRPGVDEFLDYLFEENAFEVGVWTSATPDYAQVVIDNVFGPEREPLFVFARDRCVRTFMPSFGPYGASHETVLIKDLKKVRRETGYEYNRMIAIDDHAPYFQRQYSNLVAVPEFTGKQERAVFPHLMRYLDKLARLDNVRPVEKRGWLSRYRSGDYDYRARESDPEP